MSAFEPVVLGVPDVGTPPAAPAPDPGGLTPSVPDLEE